MTDTLDEICEDIKELFVNSRGELNNVALGFNEIVDKFDKEKSPDNPHHPRSTIGIHLKEHLLKSGYTSRHFDRKYRWNLSQQVNYTPTIMHKLYKFEITIKPKASPSTTTLVFLNNLDTPLTSFCWYLTSIVRTTWKKMKPEIIFEYDNKSYPLYKTSEPEFLLDNPYHYRFTVDFPFPIYKNIPATLIFRRKRIYDLDYGYIPLYPEASTEKIEFIINCPTTKYRLLVWHINKKTGKKFPSPISPIQKDKKITWENSSHNLEYYYQFEWQKSS